MNQESSKLERQSSWQWAKHAKLCSDLLRAQRTGSSTTLGSQQECVCVWGGGGVLTSAATVPHHGTAGRERTRVLPVLLCLLF